VTVLSTLHIAPGYPIGALFSEDSETSESRSLGEPLNTVTKFLQGTLCYVTVGGRLHK
jgi:hypothetical protein